MKNLKFGLFGAAMLAGVGQAPAADIYAGESMKDAPATYSSFTWTGFYIGVHGGYADGNADYTFLTPGPTGTGGNFEPIGRVRPNEPEGGFGGIHVGYNKQFNRIVLGLEGSLSSAQIDDETLENVANNYRINSDVDWFATVALRAGIAFDRTLLYVKGGYAATSLDFKAEFENGNATTTKISNDYDLDGYVVGAGVEYAITSNVILGVEYTYMDFGSETFTGAATNTGITPETVRAELDVETISARLTYKFGARESEPLK